MRSGHVALAASPATDHAVLHWILAGVGLAWLLLAGVLGLSLLGNMMPRRPRRARPPRPRRSKITK